jgi:hypothetical protein
MNVFSKLDMKCNTFVSIFSLVLVLLCLSSTNTNAYEKLLSLEIGPTWPSVISNRTSWNAEIMYGALIDRKLGFGVAGNFLWNTYSNEITLESGKKYIASEESIFMYPIIGFILFDPASYLVVHPLFRFDIGYNSMSYNYKNIVVGSKISENASLLPQSVYYYGLIVKIGVDGCYNLGDHASVFLGMEYRWANTRTSEDDNGYFSRIDMSGLGIHAGARFLL